MSSTETKGTALINEVPRRHRRNLLRSTRGRTMLKVGLIIGSTRPSRFADAPVQWLVGGASARSDLRLTLLDLRDYRLPFFNEPASPVSTGGIYTAPEAQAWRRRICEFDAFVATVAEYNHGPTAVLKNAFDSALLEWQRKPIAFVGYGGRRWCSRDRNPARRGHRTAAGADQAGSEHRDGAISWDRPKRSLAE